jgi:hypothetical protein
MVVFQALVVLLKWPGARARSSRPPISSQMAGRSQARDVHTFQAHLIVRQNPPGKWAQLTVIPEPAKVWHRRKL